MDEYSNLLSLQHDHLILNQKGFRSGMALVKQHVLAPLQAGVHYIDSLGLPQQHFNLTAQLLRLKLVQQLPLMLLHQSRNKGDGDQRPDPLMD